MTQTKKKEQRRQSDRRKKKEAIHNQYGLLSTCEPSSSAASSAHHDTKITKADDVIIRISSSSSSLSSFYEITYDNERMIMAPPGKLGIVLCRTVDGLLCKTIHITSPIYGQIENGDHILQINQQPTKGMTIEVVMQYMTKHIDQFRELYIGTPQPKHTDIVRKLALPSGCDELTIDEYGRIIKLPHDIPSGIQIGDVLLQMNERRVNGMTHHEAMKYITNHHEKELIVWIARSDAIPNDNTTPSKNYSDEDAEEDIVIPKQNRNWKKMIMR